MRHSRALGLAGGFLTDRWSGDRRRCSPAGAWLSGRHWKERLPDTRRCTRHPPQWPPGRCSASAASNWRHEPCTTASSRATCRPRAAASPHLVGRTTTHLSADGTARAVVESVAQNTSDAVTTPLWWGMVAGIPGLLGHRAADTLDAMVGHLNPRCLRFGWASAG